MFSSGEPERDKAAYQKYTGDCIKDYFGTVNAARRQSEQYDCESDPGDGGYVPGKS
jgi:hypothetical protein